MTQNLDDRILFFKTRIEENMRRKGIVRTKTLKKKIHEKKIVSIHAIESDEGTYFLLVKDKEGEEYYLKTYRGEGFRTFVTLDAFWKYCKNIGIKTMSVYGEIKELNNLNEEKNDTKIED